MRTEVLCIVVSHVDYGESDRIVHLVTPESGLVAAMARGARKSKKRYAGALDIGNRIRTQMSRGKGELWRLNGATLDHGRPHIRSDLERIALAVYACELVGYLCPREHPAPMFYGLLDTALLVLDACSAPPLSAWRPALEAKALTFAGFAPRLERCDVCGLEADGELVFSASNGGVRHSDCGGGAPMSRVFARALELSRRTPLSELVDVALPAGDLWCLNELLVWHCGRQLKSRSLLDAL